MILDDMKRESLQTDLNSTVAALKRILAMNEAFPPESRIHTSSFITSEDDRFIAVNGSAHMMKDLFMDFFAQRPEFRSVVQEALNSMYKIDNGMI